MLSRPSRSALYLPAINARAVEKARTIDTDVLIFDLEDAVAPNAKAAARENLLQGFSQGSFGKSRCVIRINHLETPYFGEDLALLPQLRVDAVLVPKVSSGQDLSAVASRIAALSLPSQPALWAMIETPEALGRLSDITERGRTCEPRLECLVVGTNDIAKDTGVSPADDRAYLLPWLMNIVLAAKREGIAVLDGVWNDFRDVPGFQRETLQAYKMGFDGKTLIHPDQVEFANRTFAPSEEAVREARAIVAAFELPENQGAGVINLDGRMIELLHLEMARRTLNLDAAIRA